MKCDVSEMIDSGEILWRNCWRKYKREERRLLCRPHMRGREWNKRKVFRGMNESSDGILLL